MYISRWLWPVPYLFAATLAIGCAAADSSEPTKSCTLTIEKFIRSIDSETNEDRRANLAEDLQWYMFQNAGCAVSNKALDDVTSLLSDSNDAVRFQAAAALGSLGPRAKSAVPALRKALAESNAALDARLKAHPDTMLPTSYSGQAIRAALQTITGEEIPDYGER